MIYFLVVIIRTGSLKIYISYPSIEVMGKGSLKHKTLVVGIVFLFIVSTVTPVVISYDEPEERDEFQENLEFYLYDEYDSSKSERYKEYFQRDSSEIADLEEITTPVELPQTSVSSGPMDSPWPMKCHDTRHTGRSPYSTADNPGLEKWRFKCDWVDTTPTIDNDGTIYFGGEYGGLPWYLYAVHPNGTLKWRYKTEGLIMGSSPAIAADGTVYVGSWDDYLYALNPNGTMKWRFGAKGSISSSPAIAEDGTIYFGTMGWPDDGDCNIYAINQNGTLKWLYHTGYKITCDPVIGDDGTVYCGSGDTYFYAINPNGTLKWRFKTGDYIKGPASIAVDGTIYIGSYDDYLYALYPNGAMKWKCKIGKGTETNPSIASDGIIYVGGNNLYAVYPNGTLRWSFNLGTNRHIHKSSPAISADGTIYVGTNIGETSGGDIIAVNPNGTEKWRKKIANDWVDSSPSIAEDGTVYIGGVFDSAWSVSYIHAFGPVESNDPPNTPSITGTINGKVREEYFYYFTSIDPDNNPVSFYVDWGDGTINEWNIEGASGESVWVKRAYSNRGTYTIKAKARDTLGEESDWAYLEVTMPINQQSSNSLFLRFLERFPNAFPILRQIFGL